jgi:hypothetical protein
MPVSKPYRRTIRQFVDGHYAEGGRWRYIRHRMFATEPEHYVRAFAIIQKDMLEVFDFVEPADTNLSCYSYRIHELFIRTCIEIEANFKAILAENGYVRSGGDWNMTDYRKTEASHLLSAYLVKFPVWQGSQHTRRPFGTWGLGGGLAWYQDYNLAKHSRHGNFDRANFSNLLDAIAALAAVLSAQFWTEDFSPSAGVLALEGSWDGLEGAVGGYLRVKFPDTWPAAERYDFDWPALEKSHTDPFQNYPY